MKYYLEKCYEDLFKVISNIPKDKSMLFKRLILEQNKISNICFSSDKDIIELKVSVKYILFILNFLSSYNIVSNVDITLIRNDYKCSTCYWMILLCKRGCVTDADLVKAGKPFGNMAEYRNVLDECIKEGISADGYKTILKNTQKRKKSTFVNIFVFFICLGIFIAFIILAIRYGFLD